MTVQLKPLNEQVMLITGASSGIGLVTARQAARAGAKVIMVSRNEQALSNAARMIEETGGQAIHAVADVADIDQLRAAADKGVQAFGKIDTWVNNAGVGMYAKLAEEDIHDDKRLFETNFWGVVHGSRLAMEYLKDGGAIINVGSVESDVTIPLHGMYAASKHAVMGFSDALRMEIANEGLPVSVTLIKPAAINTPFPKNARNYMESEPSLPPPVYTPELVAEAILDAATSPTRELYVGGGGRLMSALGRTLPALFDLYLRKTMPQQQKRNMPPQNPQGGLHQPNEGGSGYGDLDGERIIRNISVYGSLVRHPVVATGLALAVGAGVYALMKNLSHQSTFTEKATEYAKESLTRAKKAVKKATSNGIHKSRGFFN